MPVLATSGCAVGSAKLNKLAYQGFASEKLGGFLKRHLGALKASLAVIFFRLGILLLANP